MRIGVNTLFLLPGEVGGSETYLCETLSAMIEPGNDDFVLFTNRENHDVLRQRFGDGPRLHYDQLDFLAANRYSRILREQVQLPLRVRRARVDALWSPGYTAPFWAPCPQVLSVLDMQYKSHPDDLAPLARWTTHALVMMGVRRTQKLLTLSEFSRQEICRHTGVPAENIIVTPLAASPDFAAPAAGPAPVASPYVLCVANTYPHKNVAALIEAFAQLEHEVPHRLVLVGQPRLGEPAVQTALARLADPTRFVRLNHVTREELIALYRQADLFVFPSLYEGFGLPVLEAMHAGIPVLTTRRGSIPEVGADAVNYVDQPSAAAFASQMRMLLKCPREDRIDKIDCAKDRASQFSWHRTAQFTREALAEAVASPSSLPAGRFRRLNHSRPTR